MGAFFYMIFVFFYLITGVISLGWLMRCLLLQEDATKPFLFIGVFFFISYSLLVFLTYSNKNYEQLRLELQFIALILQFSSVVFVVNKITIGKKGTHKYFTVGGKRKKKKLK